MKSLTICTALFLVGFASLAESHWGHEGGHHGFDRGHDHGHGHDRGHDHGTNHHTHDRNCGHKTTTRAPPPLTTTAPTTQPAPVVRQETRSMATLHREAVREGGRVVVYAGGDTAGQLDYMKTSFESTFNGTTLDIIVDYSKFHNGRIDNQLANNRLVPDVVHIQTLQDFPRWKKMGVLMPYKPLGWDQVFDQFKDPDGYYTAIYVVAFTNTISRPLMPNNATWPTEARDYLRPEFKDKVVITYPNDDDAVLFWFKQVVDKYGWKYVEDLVKQNPILVRGTQEPYDAAEQSRTPASPAVAAGMSNAPEYKTAFVLPKNDPFVTWPQTAAIFKDTKRPAAAKLYMNWLLDMKTQAPNPMDMWSVRKDAPLPKDLSTGKSYKSVFTGYPGQTDPLAFGKWMADREAVELFRTQISLIMGEVKGEPSPGHPGLYPEKALPH